VFERFTGRARQVVVCAQDEALQLRHGYIGTEHLLLGLLREQHGVAARVLESLGVRVEEVRAQVARIVGEGDEVTSGQIPFTPRAKKVLELGLREARALGHDFIGTEHILLGIACENAGVASQILLDAGADADAIRAGVSRALGGEPVVARAVPLPASPHRLERRHLRRPLQAEALLLGWALFGVAAGLGLLVGWLIWG
jgi:ATP-dependent Clp protease ATP-binding subunit ClpC